MSRHVIAGLLAAAFIACGSPSAFAAPSDGADQSARGQARGRALGRRAAAANISAMDRNADGIVTRDEWTGTEPEFERRDWNRDGMLSGDELRYSAPPCDAATVDEDAPRGTAGTAGTAREEQYASAAYQAGFDRGIADGRQAGKEDKQARNSWDLEGQRELETADAGYQPQMGSRADYQAGYRAGFRFGYRQGFGPHQR